MVDVVWVKLKYKRGIRDRVTSLVSFVVTNNLIVHLKCDVMLILDLDLEGETKRGRRGGEWDISNFIEGIPNRRSISSSPRYPVPSRCPFPERPQTPSCQIFTHSFSFRDTPVVVRPDTDLSVGTDVKVTTASRPSPGDSYRLSPLPSHSVRAKVRDRGRAGETS